MPSELSLLGFVDSAFQPAETAWLKASSDQRKRKQLAALSLVEAYGWVRLGVQTDTFPRDLGKELLLSSSDSILAANEFAAKEQLLDDRNSSENRRLIQTKEFFPRSLREMYQSDFRHLPEASTIFSLWCGEYSSFSRSQSAKAFIETTRFADPKEWDIASGELRDEPFDPDGTKYAKVSLFEGYLRALQHLDRMADLLDVEGTASEKWAARAIMRIEVGSIHRWELNFQNSVFEPRFRQMTEIVEERLRREASAGGAELVSGGFVAGVGNLSQRYLSALDPLAAAQGA